MNMALPPLIVIEDSDEDFEVTAAALRLANVRNPLCRCANGREVAELIRHEGKYRGISRPSLVLLDLNLGGADGRILLKALRDCAWLRAVPISVLTTSSSPADIELCYAASANAYLIKPVDLERFEAMILNLITFWFDTAALPAGWEEPRHAR